MRELLQDVRHASSHQLALRGAMVVSALTFALVALAAGSTALLAVVVLVALGVLAALNPHTGLPAFVVLYLLGVWVAGVETGASRVPTPWVVPAAWCLLLFHTAAALVAAVPAGARLPAPVWRRYGARTAVLAGLAPLGWGAAALLVGVAPSAGAASLVAGFAVVAAGLAAHYRQVTRAASGG
ncbi:hypothetical protein [Ornithinicoccus halotolerans]|uniref:hypothetical protein n=1 Tax=Ornithinicoccus halotolerans TaxID=1748220 RepID=UPI00129769C7|nr:hypothetical protein [Ornithinicoccus halotolerans]